MKPTTILCSGVFSLFIALILYGCQTESGGIRFAAENEDVQVLLTDQKYYEPKGLGGRYEYDYSLHLYKETADATSMIDRLSYDIYVGVNVLPGFTYRFRDPKIMTGGIVSLTQNDTAYCPAISRQVVDSSFCGPGYDSCYRYSFEYQLQDPAVPSLEDCLFDPCELIFGGGLAVIVTEISPDSTNSDLPEVGFRLDSPSIEINGSNGAIPHHLVESHPSTGDCGLVN